MLPRKVARVLFRVVLLQGERRREPVAHVGPQLLQLVVDADTKMMLSTLLAMKERVPAEVLAALEMKKAQQPPREAKAPRSGRRKR